jgi:formiminotetrahydrofolate cyclodeaminase
VETAAPPALPADLVERLAAGERAPGGGSAAAAAVVLAAAVVEKVARLSGDWPEAAGCAAQASMLRRRAVPLVESDAEVYRTALAALAGEAPAAGHALDRAAAVPLELAGIACDVALLAAEVAHLGEPSLRPDAQTSVLLAEAATRAAARLVVENLASGEGERGERARRLAETAAAARQTVEL